MRLRSQVPTLPELLHLVFSSQLDKSFVFAKDISFYNFEFTVSLYSIEKYQETSLRQLLLRMGGKPIIPRGVTMQSI